MAQVGDINPSTGLRYSPQEIMRINSGLDPTGDMGTSTAPTGTNVQGIWYQGKYLGDVGTEFAGLGQPEQETWISETFGVDVAGEMWGLGGAPVSQEGVPPHPSIMPHGTQVTGGIGGPTTPTFGAGAAVGIPTPEVTPAPPYVKDPSQIAFEEMYSGKLTDWVEEGGYGIPEETQAQMIQQQTDTLKAREQESLRVMKNTMERRGLTNSGLIFANEQSIRSNTSKTIAGAIADVQIKSSLMKLASFENAMGQSGQFLNYLSTQSQLANQPKFLTWQAQQMATMQQWQGQMDLLKMEINQAYQTQNLTLQAQLQGQLNTQQNAFEQSMLEMEIDATQQAAQSEGIGNIFGMILGIGASLLFGVPLFGF